MELVLRSRIQDFVQVLGAVGAVRENSVLGVVLLGVGVGVVVAVSEAVGSGSVSGSGSG